MNESPEEERDTDRAGDMSIQDASQHVAAFFGPLEGLFRQSGIKSQAELARRARISPAAVSTYLSWRNVGHEPTLIALLEVLYAAVDQDWDADEKTGWLARRKLALRANRVLRYHPEIRDALRAGHGLAVEDEEADLWVPEWWLKEHGPGRRPIGRRARHLVWWVLAGIVAVVVLPLVDFAPPLNLPISIIGLIIAAVIILSLVVRGRRRRSRLRTGPDRYRAEMLRRVQRIWVDDYLSTFADLPRLTPQFLLRATAVDRPGPRRRTRIPAGQPMAAGTTITQVFDEAAGSLLVISEGGLGKTTQLAELTRDLVARAVNDLTQPIPVIVSLSTWHGQSLEDWLVDQLWRDYDVPTSIAGGWVTDSALLPIMDGLDEVAPQYRVDFIRSLKRWRREHGLDRYVVSGRTTEYRRLVVQERRPANFDSAVSIAPPSSEQVMAFLADDPALRGLLEATEKDDSIRAFLRSPLVLTLAARTYRAGGASSFLEPSGLELRYARLIEEYVNVGLTEHRTHLKRRFKYSGSMRWLWWLAYRLDERNAVTFHLDRLDSTWVNRARIATTAPMTVVSWIALAAAGLVLNVPIFHVSEGSGFAANLVVVLVFVECMIIGFTARPLTDREYLPVEHVQLARDFPVTPLRGRAIHGRKLTLTSLLVAFPLGTSFLILWQTSSWMGFFIGNSLAAGFLVPLLTGLGEVTGDQFDVSLKKQRWHVNEGIRRSTRYSVIAMIASMVVVAGCAWIVMFTALEPSVEEIWPMTALAVLAGLFPMVGNGFRFGGAATISHWTVRFLLWVSGRAPLRLARFLDEASSSLIIRRVGNGYRFLHRDIFEWFRSRDVPEVGANLGSIVLLLMNALGIGAIFALASSDIRHYWPTAVWVSVSAIVFYVTFDLVTILRWAMNQNQRITKKDYR